MTAYISSAPRLPEDHGAAANAAEGLRNDILNGTLKPGDRLRFEGLRAGTGASMGALREALTRLETEGLVRSDAGRGFAVAPASMRDLEDIERLRLNLEIKALRSSLEQGDDHWEAALISAYHLVARIEERAEEDRSLLDNIWDARHRDFHFALLSACDSPWTLHFCRLLFDQCQRYQRLTTTLDHSPMLKRNEHQALLEAALARRTDEACDLLADHIRGTRHALRANPGPGIAF